MKTKLSILFLLFPLTVVFSQNLIDHEKKNGFKQFKLRSTPEQIENIEKIENQYSKNPLIKEYKYVGNDIKAIFNVDIKDIKLNFFKDKLFAITIEFGDEEKEFTDEDFKLISYALEETYGKDIKNAKTDENILKGSVWIGKKVTLELVKLFYVEKRVEPTYHYIKGYIGIHDIQLMKEMHQSNF